MQILAAGTGFLFFREKCGHRREETLGKLRNATQIQG
jgi:hypothetical protein